MLYHLFTYLDEHFNIIGAGVFKYISFRTAMSILLSLVISLFYGKKIIRYLQSKQITDEARELGLVDLYNKSATPTMGGIIILLSIMIPSLLFANLTNVYVILIMVSTVWLGLIGFLDDYIKVFKKNKSGLAGKFKIFGQVTLGIIIGATLYFNSSVVVRETVNPYEFYPVQKELTKEKNSKIVYNDREKIYQVEHRSTKTTIPFVKGNELDYSKLLSFLGPHNEKWTAILYILIIIVIITAVSNGANLTDGLDGLNAGVSAIVILTLAIFAYLSGNAVFAKYLNIMYIPNLSEVVIFTGAALGACIGFLWYNAYPAQVFMGDTGSLTLGGIIAVIAIIIRKELLIPLLCGIFLIENLSVIVQVSWFKYTKRRFGEGRRILKMAPLHHHYQKGNHPEPKIVARFWIVGILLAILSIITLKLR